ncbi:uncharacterized protein [Asterias amurensis]|uniref:uncharacterized protein n=1 Tax=Asterias amurensis TaxID=7602 RepID=UPI003AB2F191
MVFDQTIYVANTSGQKIYVRATYEKWQQLKFSTEVQLLSGSVAGGAFNLERASCDLTEGYTALAPHQTLKMIGYFFSAEVESITKDDVAAEKRMSISKNFRVPNHHSIIVTSQYTLQVVRTKCQWKKQCRETCPNMFQKHKRRRSVWLQLITGQKKTESSETCRVCEQGEGDADNQSALNHDNYSDNQIQKQ